MKGFEGGDFVHGGTEPIYPPPADGSKPKNFRDLQVMTEVLRTEHAAVPVKWYFDRKDQTLLGFEVFTEKDEDPCEVYLGDYKVVDGRKLPHQMVIRFGDERYATFTLKNYQLAAAK